MPFRRPPPPTPTCLTALRHRHPDADVSAEDLLSEHGIEQIAAGRLDLAVIASWGTPPEPPPHVAVHPLLHDPMVVVLPDDHPLATRRPAGAPLRLEDLRHESWVTILAGHAAREQFDRAAAAAGFAPKIRFQTASYDVAQALVGTGIGVALVSRLAHPAGGQLPRLLHDVAADIAADWNRTQRN